MKKKLIAPLAIAAGLALTAATALPVAAATLNTGSAVCSSNKVDQQKSRAQYSVEHVIRSPLASGSYSQRYSNGSQATTRTTTWNGESGMPLVQDATASHANGLYLISASIKCV